MTKSSTAATSINRTVLIVDDESEAVEEIVTTLQRRGIAAVGCSDPKDAVKRIQSDDSMFAVVTDLRMPDVDGFTVIAIAAEQARLTNRPIRIVVMTGHATADDERRARALGAHAFFAKPLRMARLLEVLRDDAA